MKCILTTLVSGASPALRETAIAHDLHSDQSLRVAVILEGLPSGHSPLAAAEDAGLVSVTRIAPGCICCTGNLTMKVTLNRVLRTHPDRVYISLADDAHLPQIRNFLTQEPYDKWLSLTKDIAINSHNGR